ncbi:MAG: hypothetical protein J0L54_01785 [Chitinophagales bacterium]|nr:hypothetical protein [Chitinophagales bacterium]
MNPNQKAEISKKENRINFKSLVLLLAICTCQFGNAQTPAASNTLNNTGLTSIASTTATAFKLSVNGTVKHYGTGDGTGTAGTMVTSPTIFLQNTTASTGRQYSINSNNSGLFRIADAITTSPFTATDRFVINSGGQIGIGNSSPAARLHVTGAGSTSGTTSFLIQNSSASNLVTVTDDGNTGIGIAPSVAFKLNLGGNALINGVTVGTGNANGSTAVGASALASNSGEDNTATGGGALQNNTTAYRNTANGWHSMFSNTTGRYNTAVGYQSLASNTTADRNTALGYNTLTFSTTGYQNTAVAFGALNGNSTGYANTGVGYQSLYMNSTGNTNTAFGYNSGYDNTTGALNTFIGYGAGGGVSTGSYNTIIGNATGLSTSLSNTIILADGQNNQRLFIDNNGNAGFGTVTPAARLEVKHGTDGNSGLRFTNLTSASTAGASSGKVLSVNATGDVVLEAAGSGSPADGSETIIQAGAGISVAGIGTVSQPYIISSSSSSYWSTSAIGTNNIENSNSGAVIIGTGITTLPTGYKLYVSDGILAEKVKVALKAGSNWADYVFTEKYRLTPLTEVESFIRSNKHLPGISSAEAIVKDGGIDVGQMFSKQMEKIEELTLYLIEINKKVERLEKENASLRNSIPITNK